MVVVMVVVLDMRVMVLVVMRGSGRRSEGLWQGGA